MDGTPARGTIDKATMSIVVAEDDPHDQMLFTMAADDCDLGADVVIQFVDGGAELLDELRQRHRAGTTPDLVILDMRMPGVDGHEVLDFLGRDPTLPPVKVGVFSSSYRQQDVDRSLEKGALWHVAKPSKYEELVGFVRGVIDDLAERQPLSAGGEGRPGRSPRPNRPAR